MSAMFLMEFSVSLHLAEGVLPKVPVPVHGGSRTTRSAGDFKGRDFRASATTGRAILTPMRLTSRLQVSILRRE